MGEIREIIFDDKEAASRAFAQIVTRSRQNFPDPRFHPDPDTGIDMHGYKVFGNADGIGTKPELAERLYAASNDPRYFERCAFDGVAMVADDASRDGRFVLGILNSVDVNSANNMEFMNALARGMEAACAKGRFPLINGETAEMGYRVAGYSKDRLNWNMASMTITNPDKLIDGSKLRPGQFIVALRERSIRSNGLTRARAIIENAYLHMHMGVTHRNEAIAQIIRERLVGLGQELSVADIQNVLQVASSTGGDICEQIQLPWHEAFPELTEKLSTPSTIFTPLIYEAQGGVDGAVNIPLMGNAHVSGGGVPLKAARMVKKFGLGVHLDTVFPDPDGVETLIALAQKFPVPNKGPLVDEASASEQWNRGVGFMSVLETMQHAEAYVALARQMGYEAEIAGEIINKPLIEWRGETWKYKNV